MGRNENLVEWNNFKDDSFGLKIRLQAGDLHLTRLDRQCVLQAFEYLDMIDAIADMPGLIQEFREKQQP